MNPLLNSLHGNIELKRVRDHYTRDEHHFYCLIESEEVIRKERERVVLRRLWEIECDRVQYTVSESKITEESNLSMDGWNVQEGKNGLTVEYRMRTRKQDVLSTPLAVMK